MVRSTRLILMSLAALALLVTVSSNIIAQGRGGGAPKPPASYPGTVAFRCNVGDICDADPSGDGFLGHSTDYQGYGSPEGGRGAHLRTSTGELWLGFRDGYNLTLDFRGQTGQCGMSCKWDWLNDNRYTPNQDYYEIQTNVVDMNGNETANGLLGIPIDGSGYARFNFGIIEGGFVLNFNRSNPSSATGDNGSREVGVARTAECTWVFTDDGNRAFMKSGVRKDRVDEGLFYMPFELTFNAPGCTGS